MSEKFIGAKDLSVPEHGRNFLASSLDVAKIKFEEKDGKFLLGRWSLEMWDEMLWLSDEAFLTYLAAILVPERFISLPRFDTASIISLARDRNGREEFINCTLNNMKLCFDFFARATLLTCCFRLHSIMTLKTGNLQSFALNRIL